MSIAGQVSDCVNKMQAGDAEGALFAICAAIEATAKKELGKGGRKTYKDFIHENFGLITDIAFGHKILNLNLEFDHPSIPKKADGTCSVEDIFYHAVRCGLYHDAALPANLKFVPEGIIKVEKGLVVLPSSLIYGLISAVVASPANSNESSPNPLMLNLYGFPIPVSRLWGRRPELLWLLDTTQETYRIQKELEAKKDSNRESKEVSDQVADARQE